MTALSNTLPRRLRTASPTHILGKAMMRFVDLNIGTKLTISSLLIVILVGGMAGFGIWTSTSTRSSIEAASQTTSLVAHIASARQFAAEAVLATREMQLARDRSELARATTRAKKARADGMAESEKARDFAATAAVKDDLEKEDGRWTAFDQTSQKYADLERDAFETRDDLFSGAGGSTLMAIDRMAAGAPPEAFPLLAKLSATVGAVRALTWKYLVLREPDGPDDLDAAVKQVNDTIATLDTMAATIPAFKDNLDAAKRLVNNYVKTAAQLEKQDAAGQDVLTKQVLKSRTDLETSLTEISTAATARNEGYVAQALAASSLNFKVLLISSIACLVLIVAIAWIMTRLIARPVRQLTGAMGHLAEGDLDLAIPATLRKDEVGAMARTVEVFRDGMREAADLRAAQEAQRLTAEQERRSVLDAAAQALDDQALAFTAALTTAADRLRTSSDTMSSAVSTATDRSDEASRATRESSASVDAVAAAAEQLSVATADIAQQVSRTTTIAGTAVEEANHSNAATDGLAAAAQRIGDVVVLIAQIARQTNLLALNATIEAARAGDAGKGFAVVAGEVKVLANQTAEATEEISKQVAEIRAATQGVVVSITKIGATIGTMNEIAGTVAATIEEQGSATQEIARSAHDAASGTTAAASNVEQAASAAANAGLAVKDVLASADDIGAQAVSIGENIQRISAAIRAN